MAELESKAISVDALTRPLTGAVAKGDLPRPSSASISDRCIAFARRHIVRWLACIGAAVALPATANENCVGAWAHASVGEFPSETAALMCASTVIAAVGGPGLVPAGQTYRGLALPTSWNRLRLPEADARAHRASYQLDTGSVRVVPSVMLLPDSGARVPGIVSLAFERTAAGDPLRAKAEYSWSGKPGGSIDVSYRVAQREVSLKGAQRPSGFASTTDGRAPGSTIDAAWLEHVGTRTAATLALSADRLELGGSEVETALGRFELRHRASDEWTVLMQVTGALYEDAGSVDSVSDVSELRRGTVALGATYEARGVGMSAVYRNEDNSAAEPRGHGGRLALHGTSGGWRASLYADAQQQVTNLELDVPCGAELPRPLTELGMVAARPEDVSGLLREHGALLVQHGVSVGALRLHALRMQGGLDLTWRESGARRLELGIRVALDEVEADGGERRALLGRLYTSWRAFGATDLTASYENRSMQKDLVPDDSDTVIRFVVRTAL